MGSRRSLQGIANNLAHSFASRNNDVSGYWAIGKLYSRALCLGSREIVLDLLSRRKPAESTSEDRVIEKQFSAFLVRQLETHGLRRENVASARLRVAFGIPEEKLIGGERFGRGEAFGCFVHLEDDLGHQYVGEAHGRTAEHDPSREIRSLRYQSDEAHPDKA